MADNNANQRGAAHFVKEVVSPAGFLTFHDLYVPRESKKYPGPAKYSATLLIPKSADMRGLVDAFKKCRALAWPGLPSPDYPDWKCTSPLKDGDAKPLPDAKALPPHYKGMWYLACNHTAKTPLKVIDRQKKDIPQTVGDRLFHHGTEARLLVTAMSYKSNGVPGITFLLDAVQWLGEGHQWSGANVGAFDDLPDDGMGEKGGAVGAGADPFGDAPAAPIVRTTAAGTNMPLVGAAPPVRGQSVSDLLS